MRQLSKITSCFLGLLICVIAFAVGADVITDAAIAIPPVESDLLDQITLLVVSGFTSLSLMWQKITIVILGLLVAIPHIAPYTPWTWDDKTISYKSWLVALLAKCWNILSGNYRRASNTPASDST